MLCCQDGDAIFLELLLNCDEVCGGISETDD
jgi:hypothetical protein